MGNKFSSGKNSIANCDRCGFQFNLTTLRTEVVKGKIVNNLVCTSCWDIDHPQLMLGMFPVEDPQGVRNPRPDTSYTTSGLLSTGYLGEGSRVFQWGWSPVGGARADDAGLTPNYLVSSVELGSVTTAI